MEPEQKAALQVHVAEYQALTNRSTYFITIQSSMWPVFVLFLTLVVSRWNDANAPYLLWGTCVAVEFVLFAFAENTWQQYNNIRYIEHRLHPLVAKIISTEEFWLYERYLSDQRKGDSQWWERWLTIIGAVTLLGVTGYRLCAALHGRITWRILWEPVALGVSGVLLFAVWQKARSLVALRKDFFPAPQNPCLPTTAERSPDGAA